LAVGQEEGAPLVRGIAALLLLFALCAHAADGWRRVGVTAPTNGASVFYYDFKEGSCSQTVNSRGVHVQMCLERVYNTRTGASTFDSVGVNVAECQSGFGTLWTMQFDGTVIGKVDVVRGGGNIAAAEFEFLCRLANGVIT
jgi:hypothetical protein